jgi:hypothetical protein
MPPLKIVNNPSNRLKKSCDNRRLCSLKLLDGLTPDIKKRLKIENIQVPIESVKECDDTGRTQFAYGSQSVDVKPRNLNGLKSKTAVKCPGDLQHDFNKSIQTLLDEHIASRAREAQRKEQQQNLEASAKARKKKEQKAREEAIEELFPSPSGDDSFQDSEYKNCSSTSFTARQTPIKNRSASNIQTQDDRLFLQSTLQSELERNRIISEGGSRLKIIVDRISQSFDRGEDGKRDLLDAFAEAFTKNRNVHPRFWADDMVSEGSLGKFWQVFSTEEPFLAYLLANADFSSQAAPLLSNIVRCNKLFREGSITSDLVANSKKIYI